MKYRIREFTRGDGTKYYDLEHRILFIWWPVFKDAFNTKEEAMTALEEESRGITSKVIFEK